MNTLFLTSVFKHVMAVLLVSSLSGLLGIPVVNAQSKVYAQDFSAQKAMPLYTIPDMKVAIYQIEHTTKFKVHFENASADPVTIRLKSAANKIIHQEEVLDKKYIRRFDLASLEDGNYTFEVTTTKQVYTKEIHLQTLNARILRIDE